MHQTPRPRSHLTDRNPAGSSEALGKARDALRRAQQAVNALERDLVDPPTRDDFPARARAAERARARGQGPDDAP